MGHHVDAQLIGKKLHRLTITHNGQFFGEYERTQAADIERKKAEIKCALSTASAITAAMAGALERQRVRLRQYQQFPSGA